MVDHPSNTWEKSEMSDSIRVATNWITATERQRGDALRDLLLLADRLPYDRTEECLRFPRIESRPV